MPSSSGAPGHGYGSGPEPPQLPSWQSVRLALATLRELARAGSAEEVRRTVASCTGYQSDDSAPDWPLMRQPSNVGAVAAPVATMPLESVPTSRHHEYHQTNRLDTLVTSVKQQPSDASLKGRGLGRDEDIAYVGELEGNGASAGVAQEENVSVTDGDDRPRSRSISMGSGRPLSSSSTTRALQLRNNLTSSVGSSSSSKRSRASTPTAADPAAAGAGNSDCVAPGRGLQSHVPDRAGVCDSFDLSREGKPYLEHTTLGSPFPPEPSASRLSPRLGSSPASRGGQVKLCVALNLFSSHVRAPEAMHVVLRGPHLSDEDHVRCPVLRVSSVRQTDHHHHRRHRADGELR